MVAVGTLFSSFWILAANSWMQTPAGYEMIDGRFFPTDWTAIVFNPSFPYRLAHTVVGFYVTTGFVVLGVAAWLIRAAAEFAGRGPGDAVDDAVAAAGAGAAADLPGRRARARTRWNTSRPSWRRSRRAGIPARACR